MKRIIWTSDLNYDDWKTDLEREYPNEEGYTEDDRINIMYDTNNDYYEDERVNLDKELDKPLLMICNLGLWYGTRTGYKFLHSSNLNDCLTGALGDITTWYVENGDIVCEDIHHDGRNYYTYRTLKPEYSQWDFEDFAYDNSITEAVEKMTEPLGHLVADIYGYNIADTYTTKQPSSAA